MSDANFKPHAGTGRDPRCVVCWQDISPNDAEIALLGILWLDGKPHHPSCYESQPERDRRKLVSIASVEVDWRTGVVGSNEAMVAIAAILAAK